VTNLFFTELIFIDLRTRTPERKNRRDAKNERLQRSQHRHPE